MFELNTGPSHMQNFVEDEAVQGKFVSVAQRRPGFQQFSQSMDEHYFNNLSCMLCHLPNCYS